MFGHKSKIRKVNHVDESGNRCLKDVIEQVAARGVRKHGHTTNAEKIAIRLWTFVHGASSLELDGDYEHLPGLNVHDLIAGVTPKLLGAASEGRAPRGKKR